jgi:chaperonin GroEL
MQNYGYNVKTNEFGDLIEMGVIDPAKAVRVALENAASVAGLFLTTECVIVDDID